tara:strand:+ start:231 stop:722 length:492 start_codon:yes stop_codon:yes gene_type:complete
MALDTTIGGTDADSYGTLAAYAAYSTAMGRTLATTDALNEVNLRKSASYLDRKYSFIGMQQYQYQARAWPRLVNDLVDDWPINPDTIPQDIIDAQFEMAFVFQGGLDPFATIESSSTSESIKVGPITIASGTLPTGQPRVVAVEGLVRGYILNGVGQIKMVRG